MSRGVVAGIRILEALTPDGGSLEGGGRPPLVQSLASLLTTAPQMLNTIPLLLPRMPLNMMSLLHPHSLGDHLCNPT